MPILAFRIDVVIFRNDNSSSEDQALSVGYPTSKNRVSMGLSLTTEQMARLDELAKSAGTKRAPLVAKLIDREWARRKMDRFTVDPDSADEERQAA